MPLISVIIPVYNTANYLPKCIHSILSQTLADIELLLINDGSTDGSGSICDEYAIKDKRVRVIHQGNKGVSSARNQGLKVATGTYISFIDSDDWIEPDMLSVLYQQMIEYKADLSTCGYTIEDETGEIIYGIHQQFTYSLDKENAIHSLFKDKYYKYKGNLWDKLYTKAIIDHYDLQFRENIYYNEDRLFIFEYMHFCQMTVYTTTPFYHYIIRETSAMKTFDSNYNEKLSTFMNAFDIMTTYAYQYPLYIQRSLSIDYIKTSISFFNRYVSSISLSNLVNRIRIITKYNYPSLSPFQIMKYSFYYFKVYLLVKFSSKKKF